MEGEARGSRRATAGALARTLAACVGARWERLCLWGEQGGGELPDAHEIPLRRGSRGADELDPIVSQAEGWVEAAKDGGHLVQGLTRREVRDVGLGGHVVEPHVGAQLQVD